MDKISIIIPCFNGERTIRRCFESVLSQTHKNFEVIFIDDGSCDNTKSIAEGYAASDGRFRVISCTENKGVSAARNLGISLSTGNYIQFLDADDEMMPEMLETLLRELKKNDADIAVTNFTGNPLFFTFFDDRVFDLSVKSDVLEYYQETFCMLLPWNKLFRREIVTVNFDEEVHFAEDELFNLAVLKNARRIVCVNKPLYIYHFAPADNLLPPASEKEAQTKSCLNKIIDSTDENSKNSIWYKGRTLLNKRREILESHLQKSNLNISEVDDLLYTRIFDFLFWELSAFAYMKTDRDLVSNEVFNVLCEPDFIRSMEVQKKFGIRFINYDSQMLRKLSSSYVDACFYAYEDIAENGEGINFYEVFLMIFLCFFCVETTRSSCEYNKLAQIMCQLKNNATPEARYVNCMASKSVSVRKAATA